MISTALHHGIIKWIRFTLLAFLCMITGIVHAITYYDQKETDLQTFFVQKGATYVIRYPHIQRGITTIPSNSTIDFQGGSIAGNIKFDNTLLKGNVRLQGSSISGTIQNKFFNAQWLCYADGKKDDAASINAILQICNEVQFPKGTYLLVSTHNPTYKINKPYHLGINRSGTKLIGEKGATLTTKTKAGTLCIYSKPYDIPNSIHDIKIEGLTFMVQNEGTEWDSYQEHCHTISLIGVNRCFIENCTIRNFWGDAICLNHYGDNENTGERTRNMNVVVRNNHIDGYKCCNRNGVSVINGQHVIIARNTFVNTSHSNMPGAIDIEPNNKAYTVDDIKIINNRIDNCQGANAAIGIISNERGGPAHNIQIIKNHITNSRRAFEFAVGTDYAASNITVKNNWADKNTDPWIWHGEGRTKNWVFTGNTFLHDTKMRFGRGVKFEGLKNTNNKINYR